jgi:hypothetical protein
MVAIVSIPTVYGTKNSAAVAHRSQRTATLVPRSRSTSPSRNEFATRVARNAARRCPPQILIASSTSVSNPAPSFGFSRSPEAHSPLDSRVRYENKKRTSSQWGSRGAQRKQDNDDACQFAVDERTARLILFAIHDRPVPPSTPCATTGIQMSVRSRELR